MITRHLMNVPAPRGDVIPFLLAIAWFAGCAAFGAEPVSLEDVRQAVTQALASDQPDLKVVLAIRKLPLKDQAPLAAQLIKSPSAAMRHHAMLILADFPPAVAAESARALLRDSSPDSRNLAASYLAKNARDAEARALLLKNAADADPAIATSAIAALGSLGGADVEEFLLKLLQNADTPPASLLAAIPAASIAKARKCAPALVVLLDNRQPRKMYPQDDVRVCDMAAAALENIYGIYFAGAVGAYYSVPVPKRDEGIARWKTWSAEQKSNPESNPRLSYVGRTLDETFRSLADNPDEATRKAVRQKLDMALHTTLCMGDLPGVDAVVVPSVKDLRRVMQLWDETEWYRFLNSWHELEIACRAGFLNKPRGIPAEKDQQALAFIRFADGAKNFPKEHVWALCRNFGESFPASNALADVKDIQRRLEEQFARDEKQVVLHHHAVVLEPKPVPPKPPAAGALSLVPEKRQADWQKARNEPSNWAAQVTAIENYRLLKTKLRTNPIFTEQSQLYPGNEWPYLANAAFQLRVCSDCKSGIEFADKALILNPDSAKAYALRGMIRMTDGKEPEKALADLTRAYGMDPTSLGDEPESHAVIAFLIEKALATRDSARAKAYLKALGGLRAFPADKPFEATDACAKLLKLAEVIE